MSPLTVQCTDSNYRFIADICSGCKLSPKSFSQSFFPKGVAQSGDGVEEEQNKTEYSLQLCAFPLRLVGTFLLRKKSRG